MLLVLVSDEDRSTPLSAHDNIGMIADEESPDGDFDPKLYVVCGQTEAATEHGKMKFHASSHGV